MLHDYTHSLPDLLQSLIDSNRPALFRSNAFRVIGLPAYAVPTEIRKQADKIRFSLRQGQRLNQSVRGPLPLDLPPLDETVSEALQRLNDPELRFVDEFFWFWPTPGQRKSDPALLALHSRDIDTAIEIWVGEARRPEDQGRSAHNLAVMFHTLALDIEYARETEEISGELESVQYRYWQKGLLQWQVVLNTETFWADLDQRVAELNDPRLPVKAASQMRAGLPLVLLLLSAQIAVRACASGTTNEALKYRALIQESGFAEEIVEAAIGRTAQLLRKSISTSRKTAEHNSERDREAADESVRRLLDQTQPLIVAIDFLVPGMDISNEVRDEVATAATNCLYFLTDRTTKTEVVCDLLERTRPYAVSLAVKEKIDDLRAAFLRAAYKTGR